MKLNAKYTVFSLIALASVYVLYHNERFLVDSSIRSGNTTSPLSGGCCHTLCSAPSCFWSRRSSFPIGYDSDLPKRIA